MWLRPLPVAMVHTVLRSTITASSLSYLVRPGAHEGQRPVPFIASPLASWVRP